MATGTQESGVTDAARTVEPERGTWLTGGLLILVAAAAWVVVVLQATSVKSMPEAPPAMGAMALPAPWATLAGGLAFLAAWGVMMTAMMLPSAAPMIALYGAVRHNLSGDGRAALPTALFALVYLALWLATGIPVYMAGGALRAAAGSSPAVAGLLPYLLAVTLVAAGLYQFSPLKRACLRVCASPIAFLLGRWRGGMAGTLSMALEHAANCVGCCWGLMVVLVAAGAMSLPWVLSLAAVVFLEKVVPHGEWTARIAGGLLIALGLIVAMQPDLAAMLRGPGM